MRAETNAAGTTGLQMTLVLTVGTQSPAQAYSMRGPYTDDDRSPDLKNQPSIDHWPQ